MDPTDPRQLTRAQVVRGAGLAAAAGLAAVVTACAEAAQDPPPKKPAKTARPRRTTPPAEPPKPQWDIDSADSFQVVVNKLRPLGVQGYAPTDLVSTDGIPNVHGQPVRREVAEALRAMLDAAAAAGAPGGLVQSAYRSFSDQQGVYGALVNQLGQAGADSTSARPGHSEHQTGLAVDIDDGSGCALSACFGETPLGRWLADHCWEHGFLLRYPADKVAVTGFEYEPWHFRYIQKPLAAEMHAAGITTLEEYFKLPAAPDYA